MKNIERKKTNRLELAVRGTGSFGQTKATHAVAVAVQAASTRSRFQVFFSLYSCIWFAASPNIMELIDK
ncbi:hypothetical protein ACJX0J_009664, partial [Zea mays]